MRATSSEDQNQQAVDATGSAIPASAAASNGSDNEDTSKRPESATTSPEGVQARGGSSCRVLVAEENSVNRKVTVEILRKLGYQVDAFTNGREALAAFERTHYDVVILGSHNSEMDGYEAAQEIRRCDASGRHTPIIALTAGTTQNDRKRREAAGIDDYIAMPVNPKTVATVLARWDPSTVDRPCGRLTTVDTGIIQEIREIAGEENPTFLGELIELFLGSTPMRLLEMRDALKKKRPDFLFKAAHSLKGSTGQIGALRMQQLCAALEALGRVNTIKGAGSLVEDLELEFERASHDLRALQLEKAEEGTRQPVSSSQRRETKPAHTSSLNLIRATLAGKRLLALDVFPAVLSQLREALISTSCQLVEITEPVLASPGWMADSHLLLLGVRAGRVDLLQQFLELRRSGVNFPILVITAAPDAALLKHIEDLEADFVLEPFRVEDILLRVHQKLNQVNTAVEAARSVETYEVLAAEDDPLIARFVMSTLNSAGFRVTHVADGDAALQLLSKQRFQLVILDVNMPKTDGFSVLSKLRLLPQYKTTPVLMLTSRIQEQDIVRAFDLGADDYVTKPFNPLEVVSRARRLLRRR